MVVISVKPGFPPDVAKHYGSRLIARTVNVFRQLGERGVEVRNIYATSRTPTGIRICRKPGMKEQPVPSEEGQLAFSINVQTTDSMLAKEYQQAFEEYKKQSNAYSKTDSKHGRQPRTKKDNSEPGF